MLLNNSFWISSTQEPACPQCRPRQKTIPSRPVLPRSLPPLSHLFTTAQSSAAAARHSHLLAHSLATALETPLLPPAPPEKAVPVQVVAEERKKGNGSSGARKEGVYEAFEVFRAVEQKDVMLLMEVRDRQFELLLQPTAGGGSTPLVHAMRLGPSHREIAILLTGAISRRVNEVTDEDLLSATPATKSLLRSIRTSLKLAISYSLASSQPDLIASYLQVIIMSDGDKWIRESTQRIALALRAGREGRAVGAAEKVLDKWVSRELKKEEIAAVGEYVSNAVGDLVLLALWSRVGDVLRDAPQIPTWLFARDDRITKAVEEHLVDVKKSGGYAKLSRLVRTQLEGALEILGRRNVGGRERVEKLKELLDEK